MKTLIFNGSPRKNGDTVTLINELVRKLEGEYKIVNCYYDNIKPCVDCRYCVKNIGCAQKDDMQEIYSYIESCDNILIASPVYFSELTGQMLNVMSRLQTYFCARYFRHEKPFEEDKKGGIILAGGGCGKCDKALDTAQSLLKAMGVTKERIFMPIVSDNTDNVPAVEDASAIKGASLLADYFNSQDIM